MDLSKFVWTREPADYKIENGTIDCDETAHRSVAADLLSFPE